MVATPIKPSATQVPTIQTQIADKFAIGDGQPLALLAGPASSSLKTLRLRWQKAF